MFNNNFYSPPSTYCGGMKIHIVPDHKCYKTTTSSPIRRRFGRPLLRTVRRKRFIGWTNSMIDGQIIENKKNNIFYMNARTKAQLDIQLRKSV